MSSDFEKVGKLWHCVCETCEKKFKIRCQPKKWKYRHLITWQAKQDQHDLVLFCSEDCKDIGLKPVGSFKK